MHAAEDALTDDVARRILRDESHEQVDILGKEFINFGLGAKIYFRDCKFPRVEMYIEVMFVRGEWMPIQDGWYD